MYEEFCKCLKIKMLQLKIKILEMFKMTAGTFKFPRVPPGQKVCKLKSVRLSACSKLKKNIPGNLEQLNGEFTDFF